MWEEGERWKSVEAKETGEKVEKLPIYPDSQFFFVFVSFSSFYKRNRVTCLSIFKVKTLRKTYTYTYASKM